MHHPRDVFERGAPAAARAHIDQSAGSRPWIGVRFECAGAYVRVFRDATGAEYLARCPRCGAPVRFRVGPGGTEERFFRVRCSGETADIL